MSSCPTPCSSGESVVELRDRVVDSRSLVGLRLFSAFSVGVEHNDKLMVLILLALCLWFLWSPWQKQKV